MTRLAHGISPALLRRVARALEQRPTGWSDVRKWWMDVLKFALTFASGAVLTYGIINRLDERRIEARYIAQTNFQLRLNAANTFREVSLTYLDAAQDAFIDMARTGVGGSTERTDTIKRYEDEAWPALQAAVEGVRIRFPEPAVVPCLATFEKMNTERHYGIYQQAWRGWMNNASGYRRGTEALKRWDEHERSLLNLRAEREICVVMLEILMTKSPSRPALGPP